MIMVNLGKLLEEVEDSNVQDTFRVSFNSILRESTKQKLYQVLLKCKRHRLEHGLSSV